MSKNQNLRTPVPEDPVSGFRMMLCILAKQMGIEDIQEVHHYVELLMSACDRHVFEDEHQISPKKKEEQDKKRFITIFKSRYLQFTDYEFGRTITGVDIKMIQQVLKNLAKDGFTGDDLLKWAFENFYVENPKFCPPSIKQICSGHLLETFRYENRDKMQQKHREELQRKEGMALISRARILMRLAKEASNEEKRQSVKKTLSEYGERRIMLGRFRTEIEAYEKDSANWAKNTQEA